MTQRKTCHGCKGGGVTEQAKELWVIHDTSRGFWGNSMVWWAQDHHGYTANLLKAHRFTATEAMNTIRGAGDLMAFPLSDAEKLIEQHVTKRNELPQRLLVIDADNDVYACPKCGSMTISFKGASDEGDHARTPQDVSWAECQCGWQSEAE